MVEVGVVQSVNGNYATIVFKRKSGCGDNCAHCKSECVGENSVIEIKNTLNARVGDKVQVSLETKSFLKMTIWTYGIPLAMTILGIVLGNLIFPKIGLKNTELFSSLLAALFLIISFSFLGIIDKKISKNKKYDLSMVKILENYNKPIL